MLQGHFQSQDDAGVPDTQVNAMVDNAHGDVREHRVYIGRVRAEEKSLGQLPAREDGSPRVTVPV